MPHYHNTTKEFNWSDYEKKAESQDDKVLQFLLERRGKTFTCEDIWRMVLPDAPLTSARRAVSNLHNAGYLTQVGKVPGKYKRPIYLWSLK